MSGKLGLMVQADIVSWMPQAWMLHSSNGRDIQSAAKCPEVSIRSIVWLLPLARQNGSIIKCIHGV
eukprot:scaffold292316_cov22-Tisochrysis_lutea.AAC.1